MKNEPQVEITIHSKAWLLVAARHIDGIIGTGGATCRRIQTSSRKECFANRKPESFP